MDGLHAKKLRRAFAAALLLAVLLLAAGCGEAALSEARSTPEPTPHVHRWRGGACAECGAVCAHEWRLGVCTLCGKVCRHEWRDGVCSLCGLVCTHKWKDGVCRSCGTVCAHEWREGVCAVCGLVCTHESHDPEDLVCAACGLKAAHSYRNGVCTRCGAVPSFWGSLQDVPASLKVEAQEHGTMESYHFPLVEWEILPGPHATVFVEDRRKRDMVVYTPPGYDPEERYNVVILSPGAGHSAHYWLERPNRLGTEVGRIKGCELLDRLIENGIIEPAIFVTVEYYLYGAPAEIAVGYGRDLRERVLPFLAANYGTWASVGEQGELIPAPEHFAFVGASFGAMIGWELLAGNTDLFSYWGFLSGAFKTEEGMASQLNDRPDDAYPIHWLYAGDGADAQGWRPYMHKTEYLDKHCGALKLGENFCFVAVEQTSHNFSAWDIGLINSLQVFFRSRFDPAAE